MKALYGNQLKQSILIQGLLPYFSGLVNIALRI